MGLRFRPGSVDAAIWNRIVVENEYALPDRFATRDTIVDVGAHIGSFSWACLARGAGRVHAYEPEPANATLAAANLRQYGARVCLHSAAVWRSDRSVDARPFRYAAGNTAAGDVLSGGAICVPAVSLDAALAQAGPVRLLKLDCEGAEFPILLTSRRLDRVVALCGEYHALAGHLDGELTLAAESGGPATHTVELLTAHLAREGFRVRSQPTHGRHRGLFWARRV